MHSAGSSPRRRETLLPGTPGFPGSSKGGTENREEMRLMRDAIKHFKKLIKEYGGNSAIDQGLFASKTQRKKQLGRSHTIADESEDSSTDSSSAAEIDPQDSKGQGGFARWGEIQDMIASLNYHERTKTMKEISKSLDESSAKAKLQLEELDQVEKAKEMEIAKNRSRCPPPNHIEIEDVPEVDEADILVDNDLLNFNLETMPVIEALKRCAEFVPEVQRRAQRQAMQRPIDQAADASLWETAQVGNGQDGNPTDDSDKEEGGMFREIKKKLRRLGELPPGSDPDLAIILEAQRTEIRALAQSIDEGERNMQIRRLALDYVDGHINPNGVDPDLLHTAIGTAKDIRARILVERREEVMKRIQQEWIDSNVPTEEEVQDIIQECQRLAEDSSRASERVGAMLETSSEAPASPRVESPRGALSPPEGDADSIRSPTPTLPGGTGRRGAVRVGLLRSAPVLEISHEMAPEIHKKLKHEVAQLEENIQEQQRNISANEVVIKNAEHTFKALEEMKTLFLEQIARERPVMLGEMAEGFVEEDVETPSDLSSAAASEPEDQQDLCERLKALDAEEQRLRVELKVQESMFDEHEDGASDVEGYAAANADCEEGDQDRTCLDIRRLAWRVEEHVQRLRTKADGNEANSESSDGGDDSASGTHVGDHPTHPQGGVGTQNSAGMSAGTAAQQLRAMEHADMRRLLEVRQDNAQLMDRIKEAMAGLEDLRRSRGNPEGLLQQNATGSIEDLDAEQGESRRDSDDDLDDELVISVSEEAVRSAASAQTAQNAQLVEAVRRKRRELLALRRRWWGERQNVQTTVRRALAVSGFKEVDEGDDEPPHSGRASLYQRIYNSTTLP